ncbi:hypothetical protein VKT23_002788 [Stygiomarasmius scandens]|uniref:Glycosyltransferase family 25 protein n=1 Tax=Marasmiellus scandens TaxID=2682957 RepID=A0ABR1JX32_9AGAR
MFSLFAFLGNSSEDPRSLGTRLLGMRMIPYFMKEWIAASESREHGPIIPGRFGVFRGEQGGQMHSYQHPNSSSESIYVVSLPGRPDRRAEMELLRTYMGMEWNYINATSREEQVVERIIRNVRKLRQDAVLKSLDIVMRQQEADKFSPVKLPFQWPSNLDVEYDIPDLDDASYLDDSSPDSAKFYTDNTLDDFPSLYSQDPLVVAMKDFLLTPSHPDVPKWKILTKSRIACWHSHLQVIRRIVASQDSGLRTDLDRTFGVEDGMKSRNNGISIILEDDIDMEADIRQRLDSVWSLLPIDWDIVFLGHCWSNETHHPAISPFFNITNDLAFSPTTPQNKLPHIDPKKHSYPSLHPSYAPKCTHAYALSPQGARKILAHLTYPPFAYSRAIDQAFAWLVKSKRVKAFSVVPSVIAQRKDGKSDVWLGETGGSQWRDGLVFGVFGTHGGNGPR